MATTRNPKTPRASRGTGSVPSATSAAARLATRQPVATAKGKLGVREQFILQLCLEGLEFLHELIVEEHRPWHSQIMDLSPYLSKTDKACSG